MPIKLLAFDLDGTALVEHKDLPPENQQALIAAAKKGVLLVPATGRIRDFLPPDILALPSVRYVITANGGAIYDLHTGTPLHQALIPTHKAKQVQDILDTHQLFIEYYVDGHPHIACRTPDEILRDFALPPSKHHFLTKNYTFVDNFSQFIKDTLPQPEKINLPYLTPELRTTLWQQFDALGELKITSSIPDNLEVNAQGATKGIALAALCKHLGFSPEDCMSIGDNGNDTDMLTFAGISVAMGNASPEAAAAAKYHTTACDENGLARAIERFILS